MGSNKLTIIAMFTADTILALIMLIGLLRLRGHAGGMFNLGRLLWKQVSAGGSTGSRGALDPLTHFLSVRVLFGS